VAVWPELYLSEPLNRDLEKYALPGLYQVIGYGGFPPEEGLPENYAALVDPDRNLMGRYSKIHLFGSEREAHRPGASLTVVPGPLGRSGLAICYDTMYTDVVRGLVRRGAQIVYLPNEDPTSSRGALQAFHAAATVFRAAENGMPIVRSEWRGYSMIIDGRGRVIRNAVLETPSVVVGDVILPRYPGTLYSRLGDFFPLLCAGVLLLSILSEVRRDSRAKKQREQTLAHEYTPQTDEPAEVQVRN
jgi:apolipoprotein N-acyltransferase